MSKERVLIYDEVVKEWYPIHFSFRRTDARILDLVCKKIIRMHETGGPLHPDLTEKELELVEAIWESVKKIL